MVFSIDGSFTASVSVTGRDPKVRAGAVDVVRHWQELGYLIVYITGRPDMQQRRVVSWLAQHNFPHGLLSFADGLSTDPLRHKAEYLKVKLLQFDILRTLERNLEFRNSGRNFFFFVSSARSFWSTTSDWKFELLTAAARTSACTAASASNLKIFSSLAKFHASRPEWPSR